MFYGIELPFETLKCDGNVPNYILAIICRKNIRNEIKTFFRENNPDIKD